MTTTPQPSQAFQSTATKPATNRELPLPQSDRDPAHLQGHWLLARIGKHVLRPGGKKLTERMLANADIAGKDVVEFAPGLGLTTRAILERDPKSYRGVDRDPQSWTSSPNSPVRRPRFRQAACSATPPTPVWNPTAPTW